MDNKYTISISANIEKEASIAEIEKTLKEIQPNLSLELKNIKLGEKGIESLQNSIQKAIDKMNVSVNISGAKVIEEQVKKVKEKVEVPKPAEPPAPKNIEEVLKRAKSVSSYTGVNLAQITKEVERSITKMMGAGKNVSVAWKTIEGDIVGATVSLKGLNGEMERQVFTLREGEDGVERLMLDYTKFDNAGIKIWANQEKAQKQAIEEQEKYRKKLLETVDIVKKLGEASPLGGGGVKEASRLTLAKKKAEAYIELLRGQSTISPKEMDQLNLYVENLQKLNLALQESNNLENEAVKYVDAITIQRQKYQKQIESIIQKVKELNNLTGNNTTKSTTDAQNRLNEAYRQTVAYAEKLKKSPFIKQEDLEKLNKFVDSVRVANQALKEENALFVEQEKVGKKQADALEAEQQQYQKEIEKTIQKMKELQASTTGKSGKEVIQVKATTSQALLEAIKLQEQFSKGQYLTADQMTHLQELSNKANVAGAALRGIGKNAQSWFTEIGTAVKRTIEWASAMTLLYGSLRQLQAGVEYVSELNKEMTNIQVVTGQSKESVKELAKTYGDLADQMGVTTLEVAKGSLQFIRQGKSVEETQKLLKMSLMMSKLAAIDSAQATDYMTSIMNGFNLTSDEMMGTLDKLIVLDNNYNTSVAGIAEAMQKTSVSAKDAGVTLDELASYITVVSSETNQSAESIGTSFKTMFARLTAVKTGKQFDELGESVSNVEIVLKNAGIQLRDLQTKEFRPLGDVLDEIAGKWEHLDSVERSRIAGAVAGTYQIEKFRVLMDNYTEVLKAQGLESIASGSAQERYAIALDSVEAAQKRLTTAWEGVWSKTINSDSIIAVYDALTKVLQVLEDIGGILPALTIGFGVFGFFKSKEFILGINDAAKAMKDFSIALKAIKATKELEETAKGIKNIGEVIKPMVSIFDIFKNKSSQKAKIAEDLLGSLIYYRSVKKELDDINKEVEDYRSMYGFLQNDDLFQRKAAAREKEREARDKLLMAEYEAFQKGIALNKEGQIVTAGSAEAVSIDTVSIEENVVAKIQNSAATSANTTQTAENTALVEQNSVAIGTNSAVKQEDTVVTSENNIAKEANNLQTELGGKAAQGAIIPITLLTTIMQVLTIAIMAAGVAWAAYNWVQEENRKRIEQNKKAISDLKDGLDELNSTSTSNLFSEYEKLNSISNESKIKSEEFYTVQKKIHDLLPSVAVHYDDLGRVILDNVSGQQDLVTALEAEKTARKNLLNLKIKSSMQDLAEEYLKSTNEIRKNTEALERYNKILATGVQGQFKITEQDVYRMEAQVAQSSITVQENIDAIVQNFSMANKDTQDLMIQMWQSYADAGKLGAKEVLDALLNSLKVVQNTTKDSGIKVADATDEMYNQILAEATNFYDKQIQADNKYTEEAVRNAMLRAQALGDTSAFDKLNVYLNDFILANQEVNGQFNQTAAAEKATMEGLAQAIFEQANSANMALFDMQGNVITSANGVYMALTSSSISFQNFVTMLAKASGKTAGEIKAIFETYAKEMSLYTKGTLPFSPTAPTVFVTGGGGSGESAAKKANDERIKRLEKEKSALQDRLKEYNKYIDTLKEELKLQKEEADYLDTLNSKNKKLSKLKTDIEILALDNSEEAKRKRLELEQEASDLEEEIAKDKEDRKYQLQVDALDKMKQDFENTINSKIERLDEEISKLNEQNNAISGIGSSYSNMATKNSEAVNTIMTNMKTLFSMTKDVEQAVKNLVQQWVDTGLTTDQAFTKAIEYYKYLLRIKSIVTGGAAPSREELIRPGVVAHHSGGFAGGLQSNETFAKLLKGEYIATEGQMNNFMNNVLPKLIGVPTYSTNNQPSGVSLSMPITVQGNLDSSVLPEIEKIANKVINEINNTMKSRGIIRRTDLVSI